MAQIKLLDPAETAKIARERAEEAKKALEAARKKAKPAQEAVAEPAEAAATVTGAGEGGELGQGAQPLSSGHVSSVSGIKPTLLPLLASQNVTRIGECYSGSMVIARTWA